jgi:hypothetical protein
MLTVEEVKELPRALPLTDWSQREYNVPGSELLVRKSKHVWSITEHGHPILIIGIYEPSFIGTIPELWLLMGEDFRKQLKRNLTFIRGQMDELLSYYPRLETRVDVDFQSGHRFAKAMGFKPIRQRLYSDGRDYVVYEVRRGS